MGSGKKGARTFAAIATPSTARGGFEILSKGVAGNGRTRLLGLAWRLRRFVVFVVSDYVEFDFLERKCDNAHNERFSLPRR